MVTFKAIAKLPYYIHQNFNVLYKAEAWWYMLVISIFEFPIIKDFYRMNNLRLFFFENFQFFSVSNWVHLNWCHSNCVYKNVKIFSQWLWEMLCYTTIKTFWLHLQPFYVRLRTFWLTDILKLKFRSYFQDMN